ncbi:hypothetical protein FOVSG1_011998 [Fusarium oxysporum f. sp. vasinfectum]
MQSQPLSKERYKRIHQRAKTRLNARCRDLLYVTKNTGEAVFLYQVDFVHRTARDFFLDTGVIDKIIQQRPTQDFNPHLSLCKVMLALTKALTNYQSISTFVADLMYYARTIEDMYGQPDLYRDTPISFGSLTEMFGILDELARVNTERSVTPDVHLLDNLEHLSKDYFKKPRLNNVLAPAVQAGLLLYVEDRLRRHPSELQLNTGRPLLDYALRPGNTAPMLRSPSETVPIIPILKLLLHLGANPNARVDMYDGKTTWGCFLETCQQHAARKRSPEEVEKIAAALELMIDYGARVEGHFGPLTFMELLDEINLPPHWVSRIQEMTENNEICTDDKCEYCTRRIEKMRDHTPAHGKKVSQHTSATPLWRAYKLQTYFTAKGLIDYLVVGEEEWPSSSSSSPVRGGEQAPSQEERKLFGDLKADVDQASRDLDSRAEVMQGIEASRADRAP